MNKHLLYQIQEELDCNGSQKNVGQGSEINQYLTLYELLNRENIEHDKDLATTIQIKLSQKKNSSWSDVYIFILVQLLLVTIGVGINAMF